MNLLGPTRHRRLNEAAAFVYLFAGLFVALSLLSYYPADPSFNTAVGAVKPHNLTGVVGAYLSDLLFQCFGLTAFGLPALMLVVAWRWMRSRPIDAQAVRVIAAGMLFFSLSTALALLRSFRPWHGAFTAGGILGLVLSDSLLASFNLAGTLLIVATTFILGVYLISTFSMATLDGWLAPPRRMLARMGDRFAAWRERRRQEAIDRAKARAEKRLQARREKPEPAARPAQRRTKQEPPAVEERPSGVDLPFDLDEEDTPPLAAPPLDEIPIRELEFTPPPPPAAPMPPPEPEVDRKGAHASRRPHDEYHVPPTELLNEPPGRNTFDSAELKETAGLIKARLEEFNVLGNVVQINPGPVVTTFEYKPDAGIKYSRITALTEDLCLGLQAESVLIERIPGKPTVGIEVPNSHREVISLRQILESEEFRNSSSKLTICLGKDINGRIKVASLESMPHLLIAGSTGSGKSVMLNSLIMSVLYKSTPDEIRLIMVDPKRVELGIYEGIPHLLTPVITDAKKATNALKNAVFEMERRLKLLASQGVRNIDQFNRKVRQMQAQPRSLFEEDAAPEEDELRPLPYILIIIDELADLMMLERAGVEQAVTRLAQMARAVGMHLVLATQRPSVDVITGLIKANFPSRISFRVATRVDSRTVLDVMGAEHLLGKGDMLYLPPGSSRLVRVHGAYVSENEINRVVEFWKEQAPPEYDQTFLMAPPSEDEEGGGEDEAIDGTEDPMYQDAVRVVLEMGKASTSTLQRRLRLGYGRAARILDMMQREGIIGPPDGSKPRDVLKRPDWLSEVESTRF